MNEEPLIKLIALYTNLKHSFQSTSSEVVYFITAISPRKQGNGPCFGLVSRMAGFRVHVRRQPWGYPAEGSFRERNCTCKSKEWRRAWVYNPLAKSWNPKTFDDKSRTFSLPSSTSRPDFLAKPLYEPASHFLSSNYEPWLALPHPLQSIHVPQGCQVPGPYQFCYCWSSGEVLVLLDSSHS